MAGDGSGARAAGRECHLSLAAAARSRRACSTNHSTRAALPSTPVPHLWQVLVHHLLALLHQNRLSSDGLQAAASGDMVGSVHCRRRQALMQSNRAGMVGTGHTISAGRREHFPW
jgi:hypothetical protein